MVNKNNLSDEKLMPPPMNEAWWEAILAEDESRHTPSPTRLSNQNGSDQPSTENYLHESVEEMDWQKATQIYENDQVISLMVIGCNRGGLLVRGDNMHGFVPLSHLIGVHCQENDAENILVRYQDQAINLKIIELDQERGRVVFSERAAQASPGSRKRLLENLRPGDCTWGIVTNITDFGIFVDLGGVEGLVHVSEISWGRVHHPSDIVTLGQNVEVYVIQIDQERTRIALSLKRLRPNPWETVEQRYYPGQITEAVITSIVPFGAFARLEEGLDGLIHISEINHKDPKTQLKPGFNEGQKIKVRVLHVDASKQRLGLSLRLESDPTQG